MSIDLRKPTEEDLARFAVCLAADENHKGQEVEDWTAAPGEFMVFYDEKGNRIWVRIERSLRISIEHDPEVNRTATVKLLYNGFHWLAGMARSNGFTEIIYESRARRLIRFIENLFGTKPVEENYHLRT